MVQNRGRWEKKKMQKLLSIELPTCLRYSSPISGRKWKTATRVGRPRWREGEGMNFRSDARVSRPPLPYLRQGKDLRKNCKEAREGKGNWGKITPGKGEKCTPTLDFD